MPVALDNRTLICGSSVIVFLHILYKYVYTFLDTLYLVSFSWSLHLVYFEFISVSKQINISELSSNFMYVHGTHKPLILVSVLYPWRHHDKCEVWSRHTRCDNEVLCLHFRLMLPPASWRIMMNFWKLQSCGTWESRFFWSVGPFLTVTHILAVVRTKLLCNVWASQTYTEMLLMFDSRWCSGLWV
jgi:hypothetical protein